MSASFVPPPPPTPATVLADLAAPPPSVPPNCFELALAMGGTVSAGAYTAGAIDFLIEALDSFQAEKISSTQRYHDVVLKAVTGTSGGAVVAATMSRMLAYDFPSQYRGAATPAAGAPNNLLYDLWVNKLDLQSMLDPSDIGQSVPSLLNVAPLNKGATAAESYVGTARSAPRAWLGTPLLTFLTHTNLSGLPINIDFGQGQYQRFITHADYGRFAISYPGQPEYDAKPYEYALGFDGKQVGGGWETLGTYTLASAAFPLGFIPRDISRPMQHYYYRALSTSLTPSGPEDLWVLQLDWEAILNTNNDPFTLGNIRYSTADGGVVDNEPIELARTALCGVLGRNPRGGTVANRAVVLIDPFAGEADMAPFSVRGLLDFGTASLNAALQHSRYDTADLVLAVHPDVYSRFMLSASRGELSGGAALATSGLDAFLGFAHRAFRRHDYYLGRQNCQNFLRNVFRLPKDNPVFAAWTPMQVAKFVDSSNELPIIPLFGSASQDEGLDNWPYGALDPAIYADAIKTRFDAITKAELPDTLWGKALSGVINFLGSGDAAGFIVNAMRKALADAKLGPPVT